MTNLTPFVNVKFYSTPLFSILTANLANVGKLYCSDRIITRWIFTCSGCQGHDHPLMRGRKEVSATTGDSGALVMVDSRDITMRQRAGKRRKRTANRREKTATEGE